MNNDSLIDTIAPIILQGRENHESCTITAKKIIRAVGDSARSAEVTGKVGVAHLASPPPPVSNRSRSDVVPSEISLKKVLKRLDDAAFRASSLTTTLYLPIEQAQAIVSEAFDAMKTVLSKDVAIARAALCVLENPYEAIVDTLWLTEKRHSPTLFEHLIGEIGLELTTDAEEDKKIIRTFIAGASNVD